jgi:hypothetical protein
VVCPSAGYTNEGEPVCSDGYVDTYNYGCYTQPTWSWPDDWLQIVDNQSYCGTTGTYNTGGQNLRDLDWYYYELTDPVALIRAHVKGEFQPDVYLLAYGCDPLTILSEGAADPCGDAYASGALLPGTYFIVVSCFGTVTCGKPYKFWIEKGTAGACVIGNTCFEASQNVCIALGGQWTDEPCVPPAVACCFPDGTCQDLTAAACTAQGGSPRPYPSACATTQCPQPGACCYADGTCRVVQQSPCEDAGGTWNGAPSCDPNPCPGACCFFDGTCDELNRAQCSAQGGTFLGEGVSCGPNPCTYVSACCLSSGNCLQAAWPACLNLGGEFLGWPGQPPVPCEPNPCLPGACCLGEACHQLPSYDCEQEGGLFVGVGIPCDPNPCTVGACCFFDGTCDELNRAQCSAQGGTFLGEGVSCGPNPCTYVSACCLSSGNCLQAAWPACLNLGGEFLGWPGQPPVPCEPNPCLPGACCLGEACQQLPSYDCEQEGGLFVGVGIPCDPNPCTVGACCLPDDGCQLLSPYQCTEAGGEFQGEGVSCVPNPCPAVCCFGHNCRAWNPDDAQRCRRLGGYFRAPVRCEQFPPPCDCVGLGIRADANCDGVINAFDIDAFVLGLTNPAAWMAQHPQQNIFCVCDVNCDGQINAFDIDAFVQCLTQGGCPPCP